MKLVFLLIMLFVFSPKIFAQDSLKNHRIIILKSNAIAWGFQSPNLAFEVQTVKNNSLIGGYSYALNLPYSTLWIDYRVYLSKKNNLRGLYISPGYLLAYNKSENDNFVGLSVGSQFFNTKRNKNFVLDLNAGFYRYLTMPNFGTESFSIGGIPKITLALGYVVNK